MPRADEVICTSDEDFVKRVAEITEGRGAYGAVDSVGGSMTKQLVASVRKGGTGERPMLTLPGDLQLLCAFWRR